MTKTMKRLGLILLAVFMVLIAVACAPSTMKAAKRQLENAGYSVTLHEYDKESEEFVYQGKKGYLTAKNKTFGWKLEAHLFVSGTVANENYDKLNIPSGAHTNKKDGWVVWGDYMAVEVFLKNI